MENVIAVVVTYNRKKLLSECLQALEQQTHPIRKLIIVDNHSTDGTSEWLQDNSKENYIVLTMQENIGGAGGFNRGMQEACKYDCDYVLVLDDDCILTEDYIEKLLNVERLIKGKVPNLNISALCGTVYEHGKIATNHRGYMVRHRFGRIFDYWCEYDLSKYKQKILRCDIASFCGFMVARETIEKMGYPKTEYFIKCDDTEYSLRIGQVGKIINVNEATLNHKVKTHGPSSKFDWKSYYDVRNGIDMTIKNKFYICAIKILIKSFAVSYANKCSRLWLTAVRDGFKGRLGKNEC